MRAAVFVLGLFGGIAHADPEADPVTVAGDANLESESAHHDSYVTLALGGGLTIGYGIRDSIGRGGAGSFRVGNMMSQQGMLTLELAGVALLHAVETSSGNSELKTNQDTNLLIGLQYFLATSFWIRGGVGLGIYKGVSVQLGNGTRGDVTLVGPAGVLGGGIDVIRWGPASIGVEMMSIAMLNRDGILSSGGLMLNLSID